MPWPGERAEPPEEPPTEPQELLQTYLSKESQDMPDLTVSKELVLTAIK